MPAQHSSLLESLSSSSEATRRLQYEASILCSAACFNHTGCAFACGSNYVPYPLLEEVYNHSNHAVNDDDDFADLGVNDFISAQHRIASHRLHCHHGRMNQQEAGLLGHGLEDWDPSEENNVMAGVMEMSMGCAVSISMLGVENDMITNQRVYLSFCL